MKFYLILCFLLANNDVFGQNREFFDALGLIESSNNPKAHNKQENAIGIYQIRAQYFTDAQKTDKSLSKYTHNDCFRPIIARKVVLAYMRKYELKALINNDLETLARAHNGGPNWRRKKHLTDNYVKKFNAALGQKFRLAMNID